MSSAALRLEKIHAEIDRAAKLARRSPAEVTVVAVTKSRGVEDIVPLIDAGHRHFGESRVQEAMGKWSELKRRHPDLILHGIGRLQSNKAQPAVTLFDVIHSIDRASLLEALTTAAAQTGRSPSVYVQVNIGGEKQKGGCAIDEIGGLVEAVRASRLPLAGLMAIPPLGVEAAPYFALLAKLAGEHGVDGLSMGMSADYPAAVMLGATVVRVGTALFD